MSRPEQAKQVKAQLDIQNLETALKLYKLDNGMYPSTEQGLIALVEQSASSELYSLLKRRDEKAVTERAYENPVFVEDLVRNVAVKLNAHGDVTWYRVEAENFESIHNHNAYACIEKG